MLDDVTFIMFTSLGYYVFLMFSLYVKCPVVVCSPCGDHTLYYIYVGLAHCTLDGSLYILHHLRETLAEPSSSPLSLILSQSLLFSYGIRALLLILRVSFDPPRRRRRRSTLPMAGL